MNLLYILIFILFLLQLIDSYTTRMVLNNGGVEMNPIAKKLMNIFTINGYLAGKGVVVTALGYFVGKENLWILVGICTWYGFWMYHNWTQLPNK